MGPGWKGSPWTKTLAYYENSQITAVKSLITLGPALSIRPDPAHQQGACPRRPQTHDRLEPPQRHSGTVVGR